MLRKNERDVLNEKGSFRFFWIWFNEQTEKENKILLNNQLNDFIRYDILRKINEILFKDCFLPFVYV